MELGHRMAWSSIERVCLVVPELPELTMNIGAPERYCTPMQEGVIVIG